MIDPTMGPILELLANWLPSRRWFPSKDDTAGLRDRLRIKGFLDLSDLGAPPQTRIWILLVEVAGRDTADTLLQLPLTVHPVGSMTDSVLSKVPERAVIGSFKDDGQDGREFTLLDGPFDELFVQAWVTGMTCTARLQAPTRPQPGSDPPEIRWECDESTASIWASTPAISDSGSQVITSEQSNTSVVIPGNPGMILKIFRVLSAGANPDVTVPQAIATSNWAQVPRPLGWSTLSWENNAREPTTAAPLNHIGHGCVMSEFVTDAQDGFELACAMARDGKDFSQLASQLGVITAELHDRLSSAFGMFTSPLPRELAATLAERAAWALGKVPDLQSYASRIVAFHHEVAKLRELPPRQRVHGDLHLGQIMYSRQLVGGAPRGWVILDFEGEPLRPLEQRTRPDLADRDVAGLVRSIDYAFAVGNGTSRTWATQAQTSFVTSYRAQKTASRRHSAVDASTEALLLAAFELDKALYESVYEAQNRPNWLTIPRSALDRILN